MSQNRKMIRILFFLNFICFFNFLPISAQTSKAFYKHFKGKIDGKYEVVMDLNRHGEELSGSYYYTKYKIPMAISGKIRGNQITLEEFAPSQQKTGSFVGQLNGENLSGTWYNVTKSKSFSFALTEDYSQSVSFEMYATKKTERLRKNLQSSAKGELAVEYLYPTAYTNANILRKLQELFYKLVFGENIPAGATPATKLQNFQSNFFTEYHADRDEVSDEEAQSYMYNHTLEIGTGVLFNERQLLTVYVHSYEYGGGAHGYGSSTYEVYDLRTGNTLKLSDILKTGQETKLRQLLEKQFRKQREIPENQTLKEYGLYENFIKPNDNFYLDRSGIGFWYNPYEIAPYALGPSEIYIPFSMLEGMLKAEGVVGRLVD